MVDWWMSEWVDWLLLSRAQRHGWSPEESVEFIRSKRPHVKIRHKEWTALKTYQQQNFSRRPTK